MKQTSNTSKPDTSYDAPPLTQADFDRARFRVGGQNASRAEWKSAVRAKVPKQRVNIRRKAR